MTRSPDRPMVPVAVALGSNLGDRRGHLGWAIAALCGRLSNLRVSSFLDTAPVDVPDSQPNYLNAVVAGETAEPVRDVLEMLLDLEQARGRSRPWVHAPRTLDLDLIFYGDLILDEPGLVVPHPRFRDRLFVLAPLAEVAPAWRDPVTGKTAAELVEELHRRP